MCDGASLSDPRWPTDPQPPVLQRAVGALRVGVKRLGAETVLADLRQAGPLKARFPKRIVPGWMDVVTLNTGGGIAGGDRLDLAFDIGSGARATIAAQAAERFYRALAADAPSRVWTRVSVAPGASLEWLPQETILFDRSALDRRLLVDMAEDASFLGVETLVFGRAAMGETLLQGWLRDLIQVRRGGELLLHDQIRMDGDIEALMRRSAIGQGARVLATLVFVAPDAADRLDAVRESFRMNRSLPGRCADGPVEAAASAWNGMLVARILGCDSASVRRSVIAALDVPRASRPMPRVWLC